MPVDVTRIEDGTIAHAHCTGVLKEADIRASVGFAFGSHRIEPGMDRIVTIGRDAQLHELDADALQSIQGRVLDMETLDGRPASFRSVLVYETAAQELVVKLYRAIWDRLYLPGVEFHVVESFDAALEALRQPACTARG